MDVPSIFYGAFLKSHGFRRNLQTSEVLIIHTLGNRKKGYTVHTRSVTWVSVPRAAWAPKMRRAELNAAGATRVGP